MASIEVKKVSESHNGKALGAGLLKKVDKGTSLSPWEKELARILKKEMKFCLLKLLC